MASIISRSAEETQAAGRQLAAELQGGDVLVLQGDLGAGKTQFVKGLAQGLGYAGSVTSPTFTIVHEYPAAPISLYHLDLYRMSDADDFLRSGMDEYLPSDGITAVEWGDKFPEFMPRGARWIRFRALGPEEREIRWE